MYYVNTFSRPFSLYAFSFNPAPHHVAALIPNPWHNESFNEFDGVLSSVKSGRDSERGRERGGGGDVKRQLEIRGRGKRERASCMGLESRAYLPSVQYRAV